MIKGDGMLRSSVDKVFLCCNSVVRVALGQWCDRVRRPLFFGLMGLQGALSGAGKFNLSLMGLGKEKNWV